MKRWLSINGSVDIQVPNEIFEDFSNAEFTSWKHKAFAYAYYYLSTYLYRNVLYGKFDAEIYNQNVIVGTLISKRGNVSYITKKNGILEKELNYLKTTKNFPISLFKDNGTFDFKYIEDIKEEFRSVISLPSPNFSIREPVKALKRFDEEEEEEGYYMGTYYDFQNTHLIPVETFIKIITDAELGYVGLYIYAFLKMKCDQFNEGFKISNEEFSENIGCSSHRTITKYTKILETKGFINSRRKKQGIKQFEKIYSI